MSAKFKYMYYLRFHTKQNAFAQLVIEGAKILCHKKYRFFKLQTVLEKEKVFKFKNNAKTLILIFV